MLEDIADLRRGDLAGPSATQRLHDRQQDILAHDHGQREPVFGGGIAVAPSAIVNWRDMRLVRARLGEHARDRRPAQAARAVGGQNATRDRLRTLARMFAVSDTCCRERRYASIDFEQRARRLQPFGIGDQRAAVADQAGL